MTDLNLYEDVIVNRFGPGNHTKKLLKMVADGKYDPKPGLFICHFFHDDWCKMLNGVGPCDCDPDIVITPWDEADA